MKILVLSVLCFAFIGIVIVVPLLKRRSPSDDVDAFMQGFVSGLRGRGIIK